MSSSSRQIQLTENSLREAGLLPGTTPESLGWVFNAEDGKYYARTEQEGDYVVQEISDLKRRAQQQGISTVASRGVNSEFDQLILMTQDTHAVSYAGPLAGYRSGLFDMPGGRVLVTRGTQLIEPRPGEWPLLDTILYNMLGEEQSRVLCYVVSVALEALYSGVPRPGQVLIFAGPRNSGKSLLQALLTELFGGRCANPYLFMIGKTPFNEELLGAGHLMVEDETPPPDRRTQREFGNHIKQIAASYARQLHGKNKRAVTVTPHQRMTISLNDEPENLRVIPPLDDGLCDKVVIFHVQRCAMPMPTETAEQKQQFFQALKAELPAFVADMLALQIPPEWSDSRFGVRHFHHPEVLMRLEESSRHGLLLRFIDDSLSEGGHWRPEYLRDFPDPNDPEVIRITAEDLQRLLTREDSRWSDQARRLLNYPPEETGHLLGKLARHSGHPVQRNETRGTDNLRYWRLIPPSRRINQSPTPLDIPPCRRIH